MNSEAKLQAFITGIYDDYEEMWSELELVIARSPEAAARLAYPGFEEERIAEVLAGEDDYTVERCPAGDTLVGAGPARIIRDMKLLRSIGFHGEDEELCDGCDIYREHICSDCGCCPECRGPDCEECDPSRCDACQELPGDCFCGEDRPGEEMCDGGDDE